jgi:hypothetical protein
MIVIRELVLDFVSTKKHCYEPLKTNILKQRSIQVLFSKDITIKFDFVGNKTKRCR